ncbi:MAG: hypothetical protein IRZ08_22875 [Frankia sp.]|nr:hypothetical protein [Frankia sp.]
MVTPIPQRHVLVYDASLTVRLFLGDPAWHAVAKSFTKRVSLDLNFDDSFSRVAVGRGWPPARFDDGAPLGPPTRTVVVTFSHNGRGAYDPRSGHMGLPVVLTVTFTPGAFLGIWDQEVVVDLNTRIDRTVLPNGYLLMPEPGNLWRDPLSPALNLSGGSSFTTRRFFLGSGAQNTLVIHLRMNSLTPLPPSTV